MIRHLIPEHQTTTYKFKNKSRIYCYSFTMFVSLLDATISVEINIRRKYTIRSRLKEMDRRSRKRSKRPYIGLYKSCTIVQTKDVVQDREI